MESEDDAYVRLPKMIDKFIKITKGMHMPREMLEHYACELEKHLILSFRADIQQEYDERNDKCQ